jgi:hypothetical protein
MFTYLEKPATPTFSRTFSENSPAAIAAVSAEISANNMTSSQVAETYGWNIGDTTNITLSTGENIEMSILDFNHDDKSDGTGKAGITLGMTHCLATQYQMNSTKTNAGGWGECELRTEILPYIETTLGSEWQNAIKPINKTWYDYVSAAEQKYNKVVDRLFLLSMKEAQFSNAPDEGYAYAHVNILKMIDADGDNIPDSEPTKWALRTSEKIGVSYTEGFLGISGGSVYQWYANGSFGVSFAFCI